jgi:GLPGLI family protein
MQLMKYKLLLFLLAGILANAQINRFFYDYKFIPDSNNKEDVKSEMMYLDIDKNGSNYYSRTKFVADSTSRAELEKQIKSFSGNISVSKRENPGQVSFKVTKSYPDFKTYLFRSVSSDQYKIREDQKPEWKILSDKQKIGEYNTQKATTNFGGREWIAWFSTDIPFQDGPYKFYGLPGLIVKIEDTTGSHIMTLVGNKKVTQAAASEKEPELPQNIRVFGMGGKELEVTEDQFRKAWKDYVNDPAKNMREMMMRNTDNSKMTFKVKTSDGKEISDPNQVFREMEKRTKESLAKNNNPIEPDLVK